MSQTGKIKECDKQENQISDETRKNLCVEKKDRRQKRKDYPETPAVAMKITSGVFVEMTFKVGIKCCIIDNLNSRRKVMNRIAIMR